MAMSDHLKVAERMVFRASQTEQRLFFSVVLGYEECLALTAELASLRKDLTTLRRECDLCIECGAEKTGTDDLCVPCASRKTFPTTHCSACGATFGAGDHGYSHCADHEGVPVLEVL